MTLTLNMILVKLKVTIIEDTVSRGYLGCKAQSTDSGQCAYRVCVLFNSSLSITRIHTCILR